MSMLRLQGALLRGTESLWIGVRHYSSAKAKEEARRRWTCEQMELLEVLEARVKQLQADNVSELLISKVQLTVSRTSGLSQSTLRKAAVPRKEHLKHGDRTPVSSSRWMEKLTKEKSIKHKRLLRLEAKLSATLSNPGTKPVPDQSGKTQAKKSIPKHQASNKTKNIKISKETTVKVSSTAETPVPDQTEKSTPKRQASNKAKKNKISKEATVKVPSAAETALPLGNSHGSPEELREQGLALEDATENFPLEEDDGIQYGNIQLSIISYLDCCIFNQQLERAQQCLMYYHRSSARKKLLDVRMYNLVMHGYAKKGFLYQVGRLFHLLEDAGLRPNLDSYIAALQCMGRSSVHPQVIARCLRQLQEDGYCLEDLFSNSVYEEDEVEMAVKAIQKVVPGFQPTQPLHNAEACTVPLLQGFYTKERPNSYPKLDLTVEDLRGRFQKQLKLEASDTVTIDSVEAAKPLMAGAVKAQELLTSLRSHWRASLLQSLRESKLLMGQRKSMQLNLYPFLCVLKDEEYVDILLQSLAILPPQGESLLILARELGTKVYNKYIIQKRSQSRSVQRIQRLYEDYVQLLAKDTQPDNYLPREYWEKLEVEASYGPSLVSKESTWPHSLLVQLGLHLVELLVQVLKMESNLLTPGMEQKLIPVLYHVYSFRSGRQIGFIRPHPILTRLLLEAAETTLTFDSFVIPMLCPPVPWVSPNFGAYILTPTKLMRCVEGAVQHHLLLERCPRSNLYSVMDSLNQLGNCPWKVNQPILDIVISIFNDKGNEKLDIPPPPSEAPQPIKQFPEGSPLTKVALKREMTRCRKKAVEMYSLRMDALYKLSIAKHMGDQVFWFPHNMDFRGRTYPCPPHFNHLGSDLTRGILLFAEGKPLGPHGLDWLKIHLINLTGLKKKNSLQERLAYANEIMDDILDSADYPLTGRKWWMNTDEPWQALACCMEIAKATRAPDPAAYISHFPVHQDGSCNGLQHYAALGRDVVGAASVNLTPCDVPQDVYSGVAQQVEVFRKRDAEQGVKIAQFLEGFIGRKVVKQTVMTVVYGVTRYGGRLQIEKRLKEIDDFPQEYVWEASHYLVQQVFNSLKEMFSGTREIQSWLTESARLISKSGRTVEWVTPLGLPIIQPYHRSKTTLISSNMQTVNLKSRHDVSQKPDIMKQKNAFPPNFIHSLDSTHMMLTALHCHRRGLTFVSVHDCYWTHALTVDVMNQVCREQFVELHSQPILEDLSKFMLRKYCVSCPTEWKNKKSLEYRRLVQLLSNVPKKGDFDLQKVKESTYFFS